jgi:hypothetical protein
MVAESGTEEQGVRGDLEFTNFVTVDILMCLYKSLVNPSIRQILMKK